MKKLKIMASDVLQNMSRSHAEARRDSHILGLSALGSIQTTELP